MWLQALERIRIARRSPAALRPNCGRPIRQRAGDDGMTTVRSNELFERVATNPILTAADLPYLANSVFNPGAARVGDETLLLGRVEDLRGISQLHVARSPDGIQDWRFDPTALLIPDPSRPSRGDLGLRGPPPHVAARARLSGRSPTRRTAARPARVAGDDRRLQVASAGCGPVMPPEDKDAALFPRRIDGRWAMIHRPSPIRGNAHMWVSYSPDLRHWGDHELMLEARDGAWWDAGKIGLGPPPLETPEGWLTMYHGVHYTGDGPIYRVGFALLDLEDPTIVIRRSDEWVFGPDERYERERRRRQGRLPMRLGRRRRPQPGSCSTTARPTRASGSRPPD